MIISHLSPVLALLSYLLAALFSSTVPARRITFHRVLVGCAIAFHLNSLFIFLPIAASHLLAFSMSVAALVFALCFVFSGGGKFESLRQLILGFIIVLFLGSSVLLHLDNPQQFAVKSAYLLWSHVALSLVGLISFLASGILGVAYLSQAKALRSKSDEGGKNQESLSKVLGRLPPLRELSRLIKLTGKAGLFSAIIGLYLGFLYTESTGTGIEISDLKLLLPTILVIYYGLILIFRSKISETMFAKLSSLGIVLTISSLIVASLR